MRLIIPGVPIAQTRAKFSGRNGIGRMYDPREKEKRHLKAFIKARFEESNLTRFEFPRVSFVFHMPIPKSIPKREIFLYQSGLLKHTKKPDTDNFVKLYLDCMDEIMFDGDQKVSLGNCVKLYHPIPKTIIFVDEKYARITQQELDPFVWYFLTSGQAELGTHDQTVCLHDLGDPLEQEQNQALEM